MFSRPIRYVLIAFSLFLSVYLFWRGWHLAGGWYLACVALLIFGSFRYGTVYAAHRAMFTGRFDRAVKLLNEIRYPWLLNSQNRAYYEMLRGLIAAERGEWPTAREHFQSALGHKLRSANDRSLVECKLAEALIHCDEPATAQRLLEQARSRQPKPAVANEIWHAEAAMRK